MSLEQAIERNTAAIEKLVAILANPPIAVGMSQFPPPPAGEIDPGFGAAVNDAAAAIVASTKVKRSKKEAAPAAQPGEPEGPAPADEVTSHATTGSVDIAAAAKNRSATSGSGRTTSEETAPSPEPGVTDAPATADAATVTEPLTYAQVQAATLAAVKAGKRTEVIEVLGSFGVKRADQIDERRWPEYMAAVEALS